MCAFYSICESCSIFITNSITEFWISRPWTVHVLFYVDADLPFNHTVCGTIAYRWLWMHERTNELNTRIKCHEKRWLIPFDCIRKNKKMPSSKMAIYEARHDENMRCCSTRGAAPRNKQVRSRIVQEKRKPWDWGTAAVHAALWLSENSGIFSIMFIWWLQGMKCCAFMQRNRYLSNDKWFWTICTADMPHTIYHELPSTTAQQSMIKKTARPCYYIFNFFFYFYIRS